jgi:holo-[acyl-carrier protein] synthase
MLAWLDRYCRRSEPSVETGIDLVDIREVDASVARFGDRYLRRIYTEQELQSCGRGEPRFASRLAARFAAKEAVLKVLRAAEVGIDWRAIEVVRCDDGAPALRLTGPAAELASGRGFYAFSISLTHETDYASAVVIGQRREGANARGFSLWRQPWRSTTKSARS